MIPVPAPETPPILAESRRSRMQSCFRPACVRGHVYGRHRNGTDTSVPSKRRRVGADRHALLVLAIPDGADLEAVSPGAIPRRA